MYSVNNYSLRVGVYSKYKFNYQLQANDIVTKWNAVQYPSDYYSKGNHNAGYMRDEVYAFFIRFIYNTGEFSDSYHIPGRISIPSERANVVGGDAFETIAPNTGTVQVWQVENTASIGPLPPITNLPDGGVIIASGKMAYWESTERYPDHQFNIWGPLCGQPIRHHKMPDETKGDVLSTFNSDGANIVLLGVQFDNITAPLDINGNPIDSIVGYEILRGSREGNKSILAKGLINNMRQYNIPGNSTTTGLYQNYPYNDLGNEDYLTSTEQTGENGNSNPPSLQGILKDIFSFHSPDVTFSNPYLNANELKIYREFYGEANGSFTTPYKHPKHKLITGQVEIGIDAFIIAISISQLLSDALGSPLHIGSDHDLPVFDVGIPLPPGGIGPLGAVSASLLIGVAIVNAIIFGVYQSFIGAASNKQQILKMILALIPKRQYAAQYTSWGFYNKSKINNPGNRRKEIIKSNYIGSDIQQFTTNYQVNNLNRSKVVVLKTGSLIAPTGTDNSRFTMASDGGKDLNISYISNISSYYAALKIPSASQYGQLESIKQFPVSTCMNDIIPNIKLKFNTTNLFGGDIYINRFTEKNTMPFFTDWLMGEPDLYEFDYTKYMNVPYPKYWLNYTDYTSFGFLTVTKHRNLDKIRNGGGNIGKYFIDEAYFYLFNSGVRDFFVESEVNVAYRDWEEDAARRHYDPYNIVDLNLLFRSDIIRSGNYYKYDYTLSISKLFNSHISWGNLLPRDYDPVVASTCYTYRPNRVIYSLPQQNESKKDNWRVFLANNYKDFMSPVTAIKQVNKTGAIFMMKWQSPLQFMGVEELKLDGTGAKITIGDGGLFTGPQQLQSIVNADESYEYGSNQGKYCSINTMYGVFWMSQNQGKVFQYGGQQLVEISDDGMKWWFAKYLPSQLLTLYPKYPLYDNPVIGVGTQMIYDNTYNIIYITKKDFKPKIALTYSHPDTGLPYDNTGQFWLNRNTPIDLTDTNYFESASFTASYDPKIKAWVSFHDWIPSFLIPGRSHFMSVASNVKEDFDTVWKHNIRCDSYCNYYGVDYPFEIEFVSATGQMVNSMRSIEYLLEVYKYHNDCRDKFHVLDENFDQAIIYNSEQVSGVLQLVLKAKNDPLAMLNYPIINPTSISIQFSKEENKYRFNQFWDITKNRGEYAPVNIPMFNTAANGYIYPINPTYIDYNKPILQRKKFRHNVNRVFLRRFISGDNKLLFKISNQKLLQSPR
jgi:hypothetical protein